jgi:enediyne biosynthesis protein E4
MILILALGALAGLAWSAAAIISGRRYEAGVARARDEARSGRFDEALRELSALPADQLFADPEATDLLGTCEHAAGRFEAALACWSRIPPGSPRAASAALARAQTLVGDLGRFADAETILEAALPDAGPAARLEMRHTLSQLYFYEFRSDAMRRLIRDGRRDWRDPAAELRDLWLIDDATVMVDPVRAAVETAAALAPGDDRVWLARAGLDTLAGRYDAAASRLIACTRKRPDDPAVWLARLKLARASENVDETALAMTHLPADALPDFERLDLRAWLASRKDDAEEERRTLEERLGVEPAEPGTLERLAVLAWKSGQPERVVELRRKKAELDTAKDRYRRLLKDRAPLDRLRELAGLAETLNRPFEAYGWWSLAARETPGDPAVSEALVRFKDALKSAKTVKSGFLIDRFTGLVPTTRPIAGAVARPAEGSVRFRDIAESAGLRFVFENGKSPQRQLPETTAGGVGLLDFDGDGFLDVYLVQGGRFPPTTVQGPAGDRLFRNQGDGTFEDVTGLSGIARLVKGYGHGVTVGDFDNDGRPDLFLTRWRSYTLLRNQGDGTFEDATDKAGLGGDRDWPTSAAFADLDNDGDLDLYVCHYLVWDAEHPPLCERTSKNGEPPDPNRPYDYCMPNPFPSRPDHLFRNDNGKFVDVTAEAGIVDPNGRGLGVIASDVDGDGLIDLFVANDTTANYLFHNLGGMRFEEVGLSMGVACNADGAFQAGMGTAVGDLDGDGRPDLVVTNFYGESTSFFRNLGKGMFSVESSAVGLAAPSRYLLGFGVSFLDANDDGRLDLAQANGHVIDDRPSSPLEMPAMLLIGGSDGRLVDVTNSAGEGWSVPRLGRGLAVGDLDNDGRTDVLILPQNSPLAVLRNESAGGRSLTFLLEGTKSNRDGVGAVVSVTSGGRTQTAWRFGGGSFQSASDPRLHFGLGKDGRADRIEVRWPSGQVDRFASLGADRGYRLREGAAEPAPLRGKWDRSNPPTSPGTDPRPSP